MEIEKAPAAVAQDVGTHALVADGELVALTARVEIATLKGGVSGQVGGTCTDGLNILDLQAAEEGAVGCLVALRFRRDREELLDSLNNTPLCIEFIIEEHASVRLEFCCDSEVCRLDCSRAYQGPLVTPGYLG